MSFNQDNFQVVKSYLQMNSNLIPSRHMTLTASTTLVKKHEHLTDKMCSV